MTFHTYWYLGLAAISIALLLFVFLKTRDIRSLWLFLSMVGFGYGIETVIYFFGGCYQYSPHIIKYNSYFDSNVGAVVSNSLSLPVSATLIAVFRLGWTGMLFFIAIFVGIEWLFINLHIYIHYWWRLEYTAIGLIVYYIMAQIFYRQLIKPSYKVLLVLILVLIAGAIAGSFHFAPIMIFASRYYHPGWFDYIARDTSAFVAVLNLVEASFYVLMVKLRWKHLWLKALVTAAVVYMMERVLSRAGILESHVWWDPWYYVGLSIAVVLAIQRISNRLDDKKG